jgi:hypothetical protein
MGEQMKEHEVQFNNCFSVSLRIMGETVDPSKITLLLGIEPDIEYKKGDSKTKKHKGKIIQYDNYDSGLWCIKSRLDKHCPLQEHLANIIDHIESKKEMLRKLQNEGFEMDFYCGYFFTVGSQSGIVINKDLLKRIADLGINVGIDLYPTLG